MSESGPGEIRSEMDLDLPLPDGCDKRIRLKVSQAPCSAAFWHQHNEGDLQTRNDSFDEAKVEDITQDNRTRSLRLCPWVTPGPTEQNTWAAGLQRRCSVSSSYSSRREALLWEVYGSLSQWWRRDWPWWPSVEWPQMNRCVPFAADGPLWFESAVICFRRAATLSMLI